MPRVNKLVLKFKNDSRQPLTVSKFKKILAATTDRLQSLTIDTPRFRASKSANTYDLASSKVREPDISVRPEIPKPICLTDTDDVDWP